MLPLKNDFCYAILDDLGMTAPGAVRQAGIYLHDTRHLSAWRWDFGGLELIHSEATGRALTQYWSRMTRHAQKLLLVRRLELGTSGLSEELRIENSTQDPAEIRIDLAWDADFTDIFEARGHKRQAPRSETKRTATHAAYTAQDGIVTETTLDLDRLHLAAPITVKPHETLTFVVTARFSSTLPDAKSPPRETPVWNPDIAVEPTAREVLHQAIADIETLQLATRHGRTIAAGIPNFVVPFGRDSIITAWLLLDADPSLARSVLQHLAALQGLKEDPFHDEEPGKIMHEHRVGELSRIGELPFMTYYGSADSTPLFLVLLGDYVARTGDTALARELEPNWRAAIRWIESYADDHGLIRFRRRADGKGLTVQSWKDSADSMSYGDGRPGEGNLAVAEVQGYVFAALHAAAALSDLCGGPADERASWRAEATTLAKRVDELFWMPQHRNYALALDGSGKQLDVNASDSGHLLWSGIVPEDKAKLVIARLFADDLWSGYGLRTLSTKEKRYNPLSYHNGSVWPHDTAIFAAGLRRYGDDLGFAKVREALIALAQRSADRRLPELVGGYARSGDIPPLPYVESCRPQAWAAAALIYVCGTKQTAVGVPTGIDATGVRSPSE